MQFTPELFDMIIWGLIGAGLLVQIIVLLISNNHKNVLVRALVILIFILQLGVLYGSFVEPRMIVTTHQKVVVSPEGDRHLKAIVVADWHVGPYKQSDFVARAVERINKQEADVVLMPGDFIYTLPEQAAFLEPFKNIETNHGVYASLGNHDYAWFEQLKDHTVTASEEELRYSRKVLTTLENLNVNVLVDESITLKDLDLTLLGQHDWWAAERKEFSEIPHNEKSGLTIGIQHNPDSALFEEIPDDLDLIVSGHTHGGQIRLPFFGPPHPIPTKAGNKYDMGLFELPENKQLYITKGIGETGPRARFFAWPEIVVLDIQY